jgi:O-antigen ligase
LAGSLAALYCVIISGSRGTLLAIVPIIVFLLWWVWRYGALRQLLSGWRIFLIPVILLFLGAIFASNQPFIDRVELAVKQYSDYFEEGDAGTPVGLRFELWRGAFLAAQEHPVLGIGERNYHQTFIEEKIANGELKPDAATQRHAHNDYLNTLQNRGVPGLILQLLIYALPLLIFLRGITKARGKQLVAALGGSLVTIGYATFSLTNVPMRNGITVVFFIVTIALFIGILKHSSSTAGADNSR